MSTTAHALVTEAEFLALPETNQPIELIDGEVIVAPRPNVRHQELLARIFTALRNWVAQERAAVTVLQSPLDIRFAPGRILQPDAMVFLKTLPQELEMPVDRIPEICIEVLSQNRVHDRVTKRYVYAAAGVQEYWIVDSAGVVERRRGGGLAEVELLHDRLETALLPNFSLDLGALFAR